MNSKHLVLLVVLLLVGLPGQAQLLDICPDTNAIMPGKLTVVNEPMLDTLIESRLAEYESDQRIRGYRVQIYFGANRKAAMEVRTKFQELFPQGTAYVLYEQPYFQVRVGDFRDKFAAQKLQQILREPFGNVTLVPDKIELPPLDLPEYELSGPDEMEK